MLCYMFRFARFVQRTVALPSEPTNGRASERVYYFSIFLFNSFVRFWVQPRFFLFNFFLREYESVFFCLYFCFYYFYVLVVVLNFRFYCCCYLLYNNTISNWLVLHLPLFESTWAQPSRLYCTCILLAVIHKHAVA